MSLTLVTFLQGNYHIKLPIELNENAMITRQNESIAVDKSRTKKSDKYFWLRSSKVRNIISKSTNIELKSIDNSS